MDDKEGFNMLSIHDKIMHTSWKARQEGFTQLSQEFLAKKETIDVGESFSLVEKAVKETNAAAQEASYSAVEVFFKYAVMNMEMRCELIPVIVAKGLSATRASTKAFAQNAILHIIGHNAQEQALEVLIGTMVSKQHKLVGAVVQTICMALSAFGTDVISPKQICKTIPQLMGNANPQIVLKDLHDRVASLSGEERSVPVVRTCLYENGDSDMNMNTNGMNPGPRKEHTHPQAPVANPPIDEYDLVESKDALSAIKSNIIRKIENPKWKESKEGLEFVYKQVNVIRLAPGNYTELVICLVKKLEDSNILVVTHAAKCIEAIAKGLRAAYNPYTNLSVGKLLEKLKEKKTSVVTAIRNALDAIFRTDCNLQRLDGYFHSGMKSPNPQQRSEVLLWLGNSMLIAKTRFTPQQKTSICEILLKLVSDGTAAVRESTFYVWAVQYHLDGKDEIKPYFNKLGGIQQKKVMDIYQEKFMKAEECPISSIEEENYYSRSGNDGTGMTTVTVETSPRSISQSISQTVSTSIPRSTYTSTYTTTDHSGMREKKKNTLQSGFYGVKPKPNSGGITPNENNGEKKIRSENCQKKQSLGEQYRCNSQEDAEAVVEEIMGSQKTSLKGTRGDRLQGVNVVLGDIRLGKYSSREEHLFRYLSKTPSFKDVDFQVVLGLITAASILLNETKEVVHKQSLAVLIIHSGVLNRAAEQKLKQGIKDLFKDVCKLSAMGTLVKELEREMLLIKNTRVIEVLLVWMKELVDTGNTFQPQTKDMAMQCISLGKQYTSHANGSIRSAAAQYLGSLSRYFPIESLQPHCTDISSALLGTIKAAWDSNPIVCVQDTNAGNAYIEKKDAFHRTTYGGRDNKLPTAIPIPTYGHTQTASTGDTNSQESTPNIQKTSKYMKTSQIKTNIEAVIHKLQCDDWKVKRDGVYELGEIDCIIQGELLKILQSILRDPTKLLISPLLEALSSVIRCHIKNTNSVDECISLVDGVAHYGWSDGRAAVKKATGAALSELMQVKDSRHKVITAVMSVVERLNSPSVRVESGIWLLDELKKHPIEEVDRLVKKSSIGNLVVLLANTRTPGAKDVASRLQNLIGKNTDRSVAGLSCRISRLSVEGPVLDSLEVDEGNCTDDANQGPMGKLAEIEKLIFEHELRGQCLETATAVEVVPELCVMLGNEDNDVRAYASKLIFGMLLRVYPGSKLADPHLIGIMRSGSDDAIIEVLYGLENFLEIQGGDLALIAGSGAIDLAGSIGVMYMRTSKRHIRDSAFKVLRKCVGKGKRRIPAIALSAVCNELSREEMAMLGNELSQEGMARSGMRDQRESFLVKPTARASISSNSTSSNASNIGNANRQETEIYSRPSNSPDDQRSPTAKRTIGDYLKRDSLWAQDLSAPLAVIKEFERVSYNSSIGSNLESMEQNAAIQERKLTGKIIGQKILSPDHTMALAGLKLLEERGISPDLADRGGDLHDILTTRIEICKPNSGEDQLLDVLLQTIMKLLSNKIYSTGLSKERTSSLLLVLLAHISPLARYEGWEGHSMKRLNMTLLELLDHGPIQHTFSILVDRLTHESVMCIDGNEDGDTHERVAYINALMKCIWRQTRSVKKLDIDGVKSLLEYIHAFFKAIKPSKWKQQVLKGSELLDMPFRTIRTVIQEIVSIRKDCIETLALEILGPEWPQSVLSQYIKYQLETM